MQKLAAGKFHSVPPVFGTTFLKILPRFLCRGKWLIDWQDSRISNSVIHGRSDFGGPTMLTTMTKQDWTIVLQVFEVSRSRRRDKGRDDRKFLEALHYFVVHNITWRALPAEFGNWNSIWKRFWRLSCTGTLEAFFDAGRAPINSRGPLSP
jgi:hypothetical protein